MPRHYGRTGGRKRPLDQILNPELPTSPQATETIGTIDTITDPIEEVLGSGDGSGDDENPWVNPFMEVYERTKAGALTNLADIQSQIGKSFAHRGGYFGGTHAIAQGDVAAKTGSYLDQLLAETQLGATEKEYEEWVRARGETLSIANLIPMLLNSETFQNIVQMPGQGKGGALGSLAGAGAGSVLGPMGATIGSGVGENIMGGKDNTTGTTN